MRTGFACSILAATLLAVGFGHSSSVQTENAREDDWKFTRVIVGFAQAQTGWNAPVPIALVPAMGVKIGQLKLFVNYSSANLMFFRFDPARALGNRQVNVSVQDQTTSEENQAQFPGRTVVIDVRRDQYEIPQGMLGSLIFRITPDSEGRSNPARINLLLSAEAREFGSDARIPDNQLRLINGQVIVTGPESSSGVQAGCFFFAH
jgi:hypothetical protein